MTMTIEQRLEALAAEPKRFQVIGLWRHEDGTLERRPYRGAQPRRSMAENSANGLRRFIGKPDKTAGGGSVSLESVEVDDLHQ